METVNTDSHSFPMTTASLAAPARGLLRYSRWDAVLIGLAFAHGALVVALPSVPLIAVGFWWNTNTIAHNFIHLPFFRARILNRLFSSYLSLVLGVPQTLWRDRHLAHHAGCAWRWRLSWPLACESGLVLALWLALLALAPRFLLTTYLPGMLLALCLCKIQGHYEHSLGTTSHYGRLYNWLFFNDGFHFEHHRRPGKHWTQLPAWRAHEARTSRWPPVLRWLDALCLDSLERLVLTSRALQRFVLAKHERALRRLLPQVPAVRRVGIVGGGLFPRTALILQRLLPEAELVIIDADAQSLATAQSFLGSNDPVVLGRTQFVHGFYEPGSLPGLDLVVIPLSFRGDRSILYRRPPAPALLVHDWVWARQATGAVVSWWLLKRLNLVIR